jgi:hypothetical protein
MIAYGERWKQGDISPTFNWNNGIMEQWNDGLKTRKERIRLYPIFQYSNLPSFRVGLFGAAG